MPTYVALLRAVNLGSHGAIAMADLRAFALQIGLTEPRTLVQSGNLVFESTSRSAAQLEKLLETESKKRLRLETPYFIRSAEEWRQIIEANPFPDEAKGDPGRLVMLCCCDAPSVAAVKQLQAAIVGRERVRAVGREVYAVYPDGQGRSKLTIKVIERGLNTICTGRNWNTVNRIAAAMTLHKSA